MTDIEAIEKLLDSHESEFGVKPKSIILNWHTYYFNKDNFKVIDSDLTFKGYPIYISEELDSEHFAIGV